MLYALLDDLRRDYDLTKNADILDAIRRVEGQLEK